MIKQQHNERRIIKNNRADHSEMFEKIVGLVIIKPGKMSRINVQNRQVAVAQARRSSIKTKMLVFWGFSLVWHGLDEKLVVTNIFSIRRGRIEEGIALIKVWITRTSRGETRRTLPISWCGRKNR